jgi:hypothetical protein
MISIRRGDNSDVFYLISETLRINVVKADSRIRRIGLERLPQYMLDSVSATQCLETAKAKACAFILVIKALNAYLTPHPVKRMQWRGFITRPLGNSVTSKTTPLSVQHIADTRWTDLPYKRGGIVMRLTY